MRKLLLVLAFSLVISYGAVAQKWTVLIYMVGADLESKDSAATNDLLEMARVGSNSNLDIIVTTGGANVDRSAEGGWDWRTIKRWKVIKNAWESIPYVSPNDDMATTENLASFVYWGMNQYPADKYAVILWNHGGGITGYGNDEVSNHNITIPDIKTAFEACYSLSNKKIELLGFDACLMSNLEVMNNFKNFANYMVASEEIEPGHGWDYTSILNSMNNLPPSDGGILGKYIADGYLQQAKVNKTTGITLAVTDLSKIDNVILDLESLVQKLTISTKKSLKINPIASSRTRVEEYGKNSTQKEESFDIVDIVDFALKIKEFEPSLTLEVDNLVNSVAKAVTYKVHDKSRSNSNGMTLYLPYNQLKSDVMLNYFSSIYSKLNFSSIYNNFLIDYLETAKLDKTPPESQNGVVREENLTSITCSSDLNNSYVVLMNPKKKKASFIDFLGVMLPDTIIRSISGAQVKYEWDGLWLYLNGHLASISDIQEVDHEDELGIKFNYKIEILAKIENEYIVLHFSMDKKGNSSLFGVSAEPGEDKIFPRKNLPLDKGGRLTLVFNSYDIVNNKMIIKDGETLDFESFEKLKLDIGKLPVGDYLLGYYLNDFFGNETVIVDEKNVYSQLDLEISNQNFNIPAVPTTNYTVNITSNANWQVVQFESWIKLGVTSGFGNSQLVWSADANLTFAPRTAKIAVFNKYGLYEEIIVTQDAASPILSVSTNDLAASAAASSSTVSITSNLNWTATSNQTWLTLSKSTGTGNATLTVTVASNPIESPRSAIVTISGAGVAEQTITLTQNAAVLPHLCNSVVVSTSPASNITPNTPVTITATLSCTELAWTTGDLYVWMWIDGGIDSPTNGTWAVSNLAQKMTKVGNQYSFSFTPTTLFNVAANQIPKIGFLIKPLDGGVDSKSTDQAITLEQADLSLSSNTLSIGAPANSTKSFTITSNTSWTATSNQTWLTLNTGNGTGSNTINLTALVNPSTSTRLATITVTGLGLAAQTISVTQDAGTTGISSIDPSSVKVYPVPASESINIDLSDFSQQIQSLCLTDLLGNILLNKKNDLKNQIINLPLPYNNGVYLLILLDNEGKQLIKKVSIQK